MPFSPITALVGVAAPVVARATVDIARQVTSARPFSHLLAAGGDVLRAGGEAIHQVLDAEEAAPAISSTEDDPLAGLRQEVQAATALLAGRIHERLEQAGIDLSIPLEFEVLPGGQLAVSSTHPDKEAIEGLLANDPQLGELATYVEATQRLLHTSDTQSAMLTEAAHHTLGSLERRAADLANQPAESLFMKLDRGDIELEYR